MKERTKQETNEFLDDIIDFVSYDNEETRAFLNERLFLFKANFYFRCANDHKPGRKVTL